MSFRIGILIFPDITQLDMTGPHEVFTKFPDTEVLLIWKALDPIVAGGGMRILPDVTYETCPELDLICVPGGVGMNPLLNDPETLDFIRKKGGCCALCHIGLHRVPRPCSCGASQGQARRVPLDVPRDVE